MVRTSVPVSLGVGAALALSVIAGTPATASPATVAPATAAPAAAASTSPVASSLPALASSLSARSQATPLARGLVTAAPQSAPVAPRTTTFVADEFSRTLGGSWGNAATGGTWSTWGAVSVDGKRGLMAHAANSGLGARLASVRAADQVSDLTLRLESLPTTEMYVTIGQRRVGAEQYETVLVVRPSGAVSLELRANTARGTVHLGRHSLPDGTIRAGRTFHVRTQTVGQGTTTMSASLWDKDVQAPATWQVTGTDTTASLQAAGGVGIETWLGDSKRPVTLALDSWTTTDEVIKTAPAPTPAPAPAPTPAPSPAPAPTPAPPADTTTPAGTTLATMPRSTTGAGAAPLGSTSYAIPADALHVRAGADPARGNGSAATPFDSIQKAVWNAKQGQTIVVHGGVYHEYVGIFNDPRWNTYKNRVTIQAAPGAEVWLDGTRRLSGWSAQGNTWTTAWAEHENFNTVSGFGSRDESGDLKFHGAQNPLAYDAAQVFIDGRQLQQVGANPGLGQFAVDRSNPSAKRLILGENPAGKDVRGSYLHQAIVSNAHDITLRGIGIRGYATPLNWMGTVYLDGERATVENVVFDSLPTIPLAFNSKDGVVRNVTSAFAGLNGFGSYRGDGARFENNYVYHANQQLFNPAPVAGGIKVAQMQNFHFTGNEIINTQNATGLWIDESAVNFTIVDNYVRGSGSVGIHVEISACTVIAGNTVIDNAGHGIEVLGTPHTWIANNYVAGNGARGGANITVLQDARRQADGGMGIDSRYPAPDPVNTWITTDVHIVNNVLGAPHAKALGQFDVHDRAGKSYADAMLAQVRGNVIVDLDGKNVARLGTPGHRSSVYSSLAQVQANHGSVWRANAGPSSAMNLAQLQRAATAHTGVALSPEVTQLLNLPAGSTFVGLP